MTKLLTPTLFVLALGLAATPGTTQLRRDSSIVPPGGYGNLFGATLTQVADFATNFNQRIISIQVVNASPLRLDVVTVSNTGPYQTTATFSVGLDFNGVLNQLTSGGARIVAMDSYVEGGVVKYAISIVPSTDIPGGVFFIQQTTDPSQIAIFANQAAVRPYRITSTDLNNQRVYTTAFRRDNPAIPYWEAWVGASWGFITGRMAMNPIRVVDLEQTGPDQFNVVLRSWEAGYGWWFNVDVSFPFYARFKDVNNGRPFLVNRGGNNEFNALLVPMPFSFHPYGSSCNGLTHTVTGNATPGGSISFNVSGGLSHTGTTLSVAVGYLAADALTYFGLPLPIDLGFLGIPGCKLEVDFSVFVSSSVPLPSGSGSFPATIPNLPEFLGASFYSQFVNVEVTPQPLALRLHSSSNGVHTRIQ